MVVPEESHAASAARGVGSDFDAVATCYTVDVLADLPAALLAILALLRARGGLWANCGPLAFPLEREVTIHAHEHVLCNYYNFICIRLATRACSPRGSR